MWRIPVLTASSLFAFIFVAGCLSVPESAKAPLIAIEQSLVFWPVTYPKGDWILEPGVEDAWFKSADDTQLHGWYAEVKQPRAVVLYAHGNAGNITDVRPYLRLFRDRLNVSILVFDYRGYGKSSGSPTEVGIIDDARAARLWLAKRVGIPEIDIVLVGHSLGGGVVVDLAARDGARGLVLENTFTSLPDAAVTHVPLRPLMQMQFDSLTKLPNYRGPLLQTHGDADRVIPFAIGCKLFDAANEPKRFVPIHGGDHNDPPSPDYVKALDRFLDSLPVRIAD
ncbi:MAG TPA: alpha/beta hydrolase [Gemmata sp.]|jgi:hypothetical protein|nr:alpha/beta hydrolase [Gemmata sp.]